MGGDSDLITGPVVSELARKGDRACRELMEPQFHGHAHQDLDSFGREAFERVCRPRLHPGVESVLWCE
ncbi:hypothetical protein BQ8420_13705 [Nocardiopsis sp. JB363]|nr:hypothetical protein BQ8420_13705 [Nocardiopsis sp. JB363]